MAANAPPELRGYDARYKREFRIQILYYNPRTFLIIDKPYDVRIDGPNDESPTIQDILNRSFPYHCEGTNKIRLVHQLDHVTSGVHVWGLDRIATRHACSLFEQRKVRKTYTALVGGWLQRDESVIEAPIAEMPNDDRKRMCVGTPDNPGRPAKTHLRVIRRGYMRFPGSGRVIRVTLCELKPESGRRHQLRVHMAGIGHAIVGDVLYEKPFSTDSPRTMLHANKLFMPLPVEGDINIEAPDPFSGLMMMDDEETEQSKAEAASKGNVARIWMRFGLDGTPVNEQDLAMNADSGVQETGSIDSLSLDVKGSQINQMARNNLQ